MTMLRMVHIVPCTQAVTAILENVAGFARVSIDSNWTKRHTYETKWQHQGMFMHWESKVLVPPNAARVGLPPAIIS